MSEKVVYYYCCKGDSPLGKKLLRLIDRYGEVMKAASELCDKASAIVNYFYGDGRYAAGGVGAVVMRGKLLSKKKFIKIGVEDGNDVCVPNPNTDAGLKLAAKIARLPHITDDELCEPFGIDAHDPVNKRLVAPRFFSIGREWLYIASDTPLSMEELTECTEEKFAEARKYAEED